MSFFPPFTVCASMVAPAEAESKLTVYSAEEQAAREITRMRQSAADMILFIDTVSLLLRVAEGMGASPLQAVGFMSDYASLIDGDVGDLHGDLSHLGKRLGAELEQHLKVHIHDERVGGLEGEGLLLGGEVDALGEPGVPAAHGVEEEAAGHGLCRLAGDLNGEVAVGGEGELVAAVTDDERYTKGQQRELYFSAA